MAGWADYLGEDYLETHGKNCLVSNWIRAISAALAERYIFACGASPTSRITVSSVYDIDRLLYGDELGDNLFEWGIITNSATHWLRSNVDATGKTSIDEGNRIATADDVAEMLGEEIIRPPSNKWLHEYFWQVKRTIPLLCSISNIEFTFNGHNCYSGYGSTVQQAVDNASPCSVNVQNSQIYGFVEKDDASFDGTMYNVNACTANIYARNNYTGDMVTSGKLHLYARLCKKFIATNHSPINPGITTLYNPVTGMPIAGDEYLQYIGDFENSENVLFAPGGNPVFPPSVGLGWVATPEASITKTDFEFD